jgi:hypothetical protein
VCSPIRITIGRGVGHASRAKLTWMAWAARTAAGAELKTANRLSPSPRGRMWTPPWAAMTVSKIASCRAIAARIASGACSQSAVLPSTSVSRKVTVPPGSSRIGVLGRTPDAAKRAASSSLAGGYRPGRLRGE